MILFEFGCSEVILLKIKTVFQLYLQTVLKEMKTDQSVLNIFYSNRDTNSSVSYPLEI